jgi:hypothetical protein
MRTTHTIVLLDVSQSAYDEIAGKLLAAGYDHVFLDDDAIDMTGIGLQTLPRTSLRCDVCGSRYGGKIGERCPNPYVSNGCDGHLQLSM